MNVLYCNPCFWDYRLPFFERLNQLFEGNFHVLYSTKRYFGGHSKMLEKITSVLKGNAHPYDNEWMIVRGSVFSKIKQESYRAIPFPLGLIPRIWKLKPDVIITEGFFQWTPWVQLYGLLLGVPIVISYERTPWTERNNPRWKTILRRLQDKWIAGYLVNGRETKNYLMSIGIRKEKIKEVGMPADSVGLKTAVEQFKNTTAYQVLKERYHKRDGIAFLFCGVLNERKGILPLLNAWGKHVKRHEDDSLIVVGESEYPEDVLFAYKELTNLHLIGRVDYSIIHQYYAVADVFVLPTIEDNWSLVIPEAMACGLPVATSIYNGCYPELIHNGENGYTFDSYLEESILKTLDDFHQADLERMGKQSIEIEHQFDMEHCAQREYSGICDLLSEWRKR